MNGFTDYSGACNLNALVYAWYKTAGRFGGNQEKRLCLVYGSRGTSRKLHAYRDKRDTLGHTGKRYRAQRAGAGLIGAFLRAALLEEFFKFYGFTRCVNRVKPERKIDFIMLCGLMGLVYGVFEKLVQGGAASIIGAVVPMHMMWQFNQGAHYFEHKKALAADDREKAKKERLAYIFMPFLFHGCWDFLLEAGGLLMEDPMPLPVQILGFLIIIGVLVIGILYCRKTFKMVKQAAVGNERL